MHNSGLRLWKLQLHVRLWISKLFLVEVSGFYNVSAKLAADSFRVSHFLDLLLCGVE
jgi:hypothetical protein